MPVVKMGRYDIVSWHEESHRQTMKEAAETEQRWMGFEKMIIVEVENKTVYQIRRALLMEQGQRAR